MPFLAKMKLSFQRTKENDPKVPAGDPTIVEAGQKVPEWVSTFEVNALSNAGVIVYAADPEQAVVPAAEVVPPQPRTPDQPVVLPSDPNGAAPTLGGLVGDEAGAAPAPRTASSSEQSPTEKPDGRASKASWEAYAVRKGVPQAEAETMSKPALMAEVERREMQESANTGK